MKKEKLNKDDFPLYKLEKVECEKTPWWVWGLMIIFTFSTISTGFRVREVLNTQSIAEVYCENGNYTKTTLRDGETLYIDCREHYTDYTPYFRIGGEDF